MKAAIKRLICFLLICSFQAMYTQRADTVLAEKGEELYIDYECGDKTFFHSDYLSDKGDKYENFKAVKNGNTINCNRCIGRYDANRTDNSILMEKTNSSECYFDIYTDGGGYSYFLISSGIKINTHGAKAELAQITEYSVSQTDKEVTLLELSASGELKAGGVILCEAPAEFTFALGIDLYTDKYDVYINGAKKAGGVAFGKGLDNIDAVRAGITDGSGRTSLNFSSLEVTGMKKPYTGDDSNFSSRFPKDDIIISYLSDKVAYNAYSGSIFVGGHKEKALPEPFYDEEADELYIFAQTIKEAYGIELQQENGVLSGEGYVFAPNEKSVTAGGRTVTFDTAPIIINDRIAVPLREFCLRILGQNYFTDKKGLIITSAGSIDMDISTDNSEYTGKDDRRGVWDSVQSINRYMLFERKTSGELLAAYDSARDGGYKTIIASADDFDAIRSRYGRDSEYRAFCDMLIGISDSFLSEEPPEYSIPDKQRLDRIPADIKEKMEYLGFAYQLTGDSKYALAAWRYFEKAGSYPDWNPSHMLDTAQIVFAYAVGYSWMREGFSEAQRQYIYDTVKKYGLEPVRLAYYGRLGGGTQYADRSDIFAMWTSNFNAVINSGAICAALAFMEFDRTYCSDILEKALRSIEYTFVGFLDDGGWIEGVGYWDYMFEELKCALAALRSTLGTDLGLSLCKGFDKTGRWRAGMWTYNGNNNFHDSANGRSYSSALAFLGSVFDDPGCFAMRNMQLEYTQNSVADVYDAMWYSKDYAGREDELPQRFATKGIESFVMRSPYSDKGSYTFLSAHAGPVSCYHSHADAGSFILDMRGLRWASDLGSENYNTQRDFGSGFYSSYRRRAEAHNVLVIDPDTSDTDGGQEEGAYVPLTDFKTGEEGSRAVYDMTNAYRAYVNSYNRSFFMNSEGSGVTVLDRLSMKRQAEVNWFMTTDAQVVSYDSDTIVLRKLNTFMYLKYETNAKDAEVSVTDCSPLLGAPVLNGQNTNEGYRRIRIKMTAEAKTYISVTMSCDDTYNNKYGTNIPLAVYDFEQAEKDDPATVTDKVTGSRASARHTPPIFSYDTQNGAFGRNASDRSLHLWNSEEYSDYPDPYQFVEYPMPQKGRPDIGEAEEISFYMAFDGGRAGKYIDTFVYTEELPEGDRKSGKILFRLEPDGAVYVWNNRISDFIPKKERWYKFSIVNVCGDTSKGIDNTYYCYIDDKLVQSGSFVPDRRGSERCSFRGFEKIWIGQQHATGDRNGNGGYYRSDMYLDDLTVYKYGAGELPEYSEKYFSHTDRETAHCITRTAACEFYASKSRTVGEILSGLTADGEVCFTDDAGQIINDMSVPVKGTYMRYIQNGKTPLYLRMITENTVYYEYSGGTEDDGSVLPDGLQTAPGSYTRIVYPHGEAGRGETDCSVGVLSENSSQSSDYSQYIQYTYSRDPGREMPLHTKMSFCLKQQPAASYVDIHLIYKGKDGASKWHRYARIDPDGELIDNSGNEVCKLEKNRWYKLDLVLYPAEMSADLKLNGSCVLTDMDFGCDAGLLRLERVKINQTVPAYGTAEFLIDDIEVYSGAEKSDADYSGTQLRLEYGGAAVDNDNNIIYTDGRCDVLSQVSNGQEARLYESAELNREYGGPAGGGEMLVLQNGDVFRYYSVEPGKEKFYKVNEFSAKRSGSAINVKYDIDCTRHNSDIEIVLAKYHANGEFAEVMTKSYVLYGTSSPLGSIRPVRNFSRTVKFTCPMESGEYVKVFLMTDLQKMDPLSAAVKIIR